MKRPISRLGRSAVFAASLLAMATCCSPSLHAQPADTGPLNIGGSLIVHGPVTVHGSLTVAREVSVHGPLTAGWIEELPPRYLPRASRGLKTFNGPLTVHGSLVVHGGVEVHGPLIVDGPVRALGPIDADGPIRERRHAR